MSIQKVITANGTEHLTARMMRENLALVYEDRSRRNQPRRVISMHPGEYWDVHDFIEQHGEPRPTEYLKPNVPAYSPAPMQIAGAQDNGEITPPSLPNTNGEAGNLSSQPTTKGA